MLIDVTLHDIGDLTIQLLYMAAFVVFFNPVQESGQKIK
jgi:hypothetical protein